MDLALITYNGCCAIESNQTKPNQTIEVEARFKF